MALPTTERRTRRNGLPDGATTLHVAVVSTIDGIVFTAVEAEARSLESRLASYIAEHAARMLWPEDAGRVHELLARGAIRKAVEHYFATVGDRWDREHLHWHAVQLDLPA